MEGVILVLKLLRMKVNIFSTTDCSWSTYQFDHLHPIHETSDDYQNNLQ